MAVPSHRTYPGQDNRPTSRRETLAWYSYCFASEVYAVVALTTYIPVTLQQLASETGVLYSDLTTPCRSKDTNHSLIRRFADGDRCVFKLFGWWVDTASFALYVFSISVLLQALLVVSMSGAADHGRHRKNLLIIFAVIGSLASMCFAAVGTDGALWAGLLAIVGNVSFGASIVCLNAFLPLLVRSHPSLQTEAEEIPPEEQALYRAIPQDDDSTAVHVDITPSATRKSLLLSTRISTQGIAIGYTSGMLLQLATIPLVILTGSTTKSLQLAVLMAGLWWAIFSTPAALWMRPRPGPPLPASKTSNRFKMLIGYILYGWRMIFATLYQARRLKDVMFFLAAWFLLSDGYTTITSTAILFAQTTLGIEPSGLAGIGIIATGSGILGAILWPRVLTPRLKFLHNSPHKTILFILALSLFIPLYGLLGFLPLFRRLGFGGITNKSEIYVVAFLFGFLYGGVQGYCRSLFGELVPRGMEANMFALYAVTDKGSSALGPMVVGLITDLTHEIRWGFAFLGALLAASIPLMAQIDVVRGKADAEAWGLEREMVNEEEDARIRLNE